MKHFLKNIRTDDYTLYISGSLGVGILAAAGYFREGFRGYLTELSEKVLEVFGGYYLFLGIAVVAILLLIAFSRRGKLRLGEGEPEYPWYSWVAMMYSTGMGAGLLLRAVQEPVYYYLNPPRDAGGAEEIMALQYTFFHWGLTPWGFYTMFGLIVSYHLYRKKRSILSSAILEDRFQKPLFTTPIDTITVVSTLLGVVAAVGLGSRQVLEGWAFVAGISRFPPVYAIWVVLGIGFLATLSAYLGVSKGIRLISNLNISLALLLLLFTLFFSNPAILAGNFLKALGGYLWNFDVMSLNLGEAKVEKSFLMQWTYFYWAFWLAWAPFTGVFIARISKGRSIRTFILGALLVPALGTFFWFSVFGSQAFEVIRQMDAYQGEFDSIYTGIFSFFNTLPASSLTGWVTLVLVCTFLITSIDSAIFVLGMFTDKGREQPKRSLRLFWGFALVVSTITVILIGKEELLEAVSQLLMLFALPFSLLFLGMILYFVYKLMQKAA